ncbi:single stranded nucleic acid binding protein [Scheffersomyces stipitis CBS 6054]|uniref:Regulator of rDNA transcription protein 5 n=1 Tax=Scheffersomyces stipitis (strain ATCC 58785 / CBS 6054 / NBRC 10063 / NRRL Y-11545) TaxID=322104 RepID=A3GFN7_PICST|nr:single stranded nucleic acid binding protein [Scheffersomyces stipitis CBS 6054]EAZ63787.2 single stranded nucleic acid binding protein [Scheffersomyces stipitis CBS 6054]
MSTPVTKPRVYLKNLSYVTTEEDLEQLFHEYTPFVLPAAVKLISNTANNINSMSYTNVLIPSHTIRFSRFEKHRPLGIAYAEFSDFETVDAVIEKFNETVLNNRKLIIKKHTPYDPKRAGLLRSSLRKSAKKQNITIVSSTYKVKKVEFSEDSPEVINSSEPSSDLVYSPESVVENPESVAENPESVVESPESVVENPESVVQNPEPEKDVSNSGEVNEDQTALVQESALTTQDSEKTLSDDTIFIPRVHPSVTSTEIRTLFEGFNPGHIVIYKEGRRGSISFKIDWVSVLVTVDVSENSLQDIIDKLVKTKSNKLVGKSVILKPALKERVEFIGKRVSEYETAVLAAAIVEAELEKPEVEEVENVDREDLGEVADDEISNSVEVLVTGDDNTPVEEAVDEVKNADESPKTNKQELVVHIKPSDDNLAQAHVENIEGIITTTEA